MNITDGDEKHSMSKYMPPFGEEINHEGVDNLIHFIKRTPDYTALAMFQVQWQSLSQ